jgi:hypothetical protein
MARLDVRSWRFATSPPGAAWTAYFVAARSTGGESISPSNASAVEEHEGKYYVVLRNVNGVLSVCRVRNDGMLKNLKRWPESLE